MDGLGVMALLFIVFVSSLTLATPSEEAFVRYYPEDVLQTRTDSRTFVSRPDVLRDIRFVYVQRKHPSSKQRQTLQNYNVAFLQSLNCTKELIGRRDSLRHILRLDMPGKFMCDDGPMFVIPQIKVEAGRFFNVSLDFLRLEGAQTPTVSVKKISENILIRVSPAGILFVSGILDSTGEMSLLISFATDQSIQDYQFRIKLIVSKPDRSDLLSVRLKMTPKTAVETWSNIRMRIEALKCAASLLAVSASDLHTVTLRHNETILELRLEPKRNVCDFDIDSDSPANCDETFIVDQVVLDREKCLKMAELYDEANIKHASGSFESSQVKLEEKQPDLVIDIDEDTFLPSLNPSNKHPIAKTPASTSKVISLQTISSEKLLPKLSTTTSTVTFGSRSTSTTLNLSSISTTTTMTTTTTTTAAAAAATTTTTKRPPTRIVFTTEASHSRYAFSTGTESRSTSSKPEMDVSRGSLSTIKSHQNETLDLEKSIPPTITRKDISADVTRSSFGILGQEDQKLKRALYGISGLAVFAMIIMFVVFFKKMSLCSHNRVGYDPVCVTQQSNFPDKAINPSSRKGCRS